jgi:hypothetical protein
MIVALLTFAIGIICVFLWLQKHSSGGQKADTPPARTPISSEQELPEIHFCQLVARPDEYEGKVVRVHAVYSFGIHGATIGDRSCSSVETITWVSMTPAMWDEVTRATENAYGMKNMSGPLDIIAVGRFGRNSPSDSSDSWRDRAPFRFELMRIEKAVRLY